MDTGYVYQWNPSDSGGVGSLTECPGDDYPNVWRQDCSIALQAVLDARAKSAPDGIFEVKPRCDLKDDMVQVWFTPGSEGTATKVCLAPRDPERDVWYPPPSQ
jgi:GH15 family glucan-1,4-alpha-glucosidase